MLSTFNSNTLTQTCHKYVLIPLAAFGHSRQAQWKLRIPYLIRNILPTLKWLQFVSQHLWADCNRFHSISRSTTLHRFAHKLHFRSDDRRVRHRKWFLLLFLAIGLTDRFRRHVLSRLFRTPPPPIQVTFRRDANSLYSHTERIDCFLAFWNATYLHNLLLLAVQLPLSRFDVGGLKDLRLLRS